MHLDIKPPHLNPLPLAGEEANANCLHLTPADLHLLPPSMQWLSKAIGLRAVLALVRTHGGGAPVYVPVKATENHYLQRLIGEDAFVALVSEYGGTTLEIARCEKAARMLVYRQIRRESADGATQNELALRHCFTVRHIRAILDGGEMEDDRQQGLF